LVEVDVGGLREKETETKSQTFRHFPHDKTWKKKKRRGKKPGIGFVMRYVFFGVFT